VFRDIPVSYISTTIHIVLILICNLSILTILYNSEDGRRVYHVTNVNHGSSKTAKYRTVIYEEYAQHLECDCHNTTMTGIACRHILRVSTQLNLEVLPEHLFLTRWCKDPSDEHLCEHYKLYFSSQAARDGDQQQETYTPIQHEDFQLFMLNKIMRKVERFAKRNPGTAKGLHDEINKILDVTAASIDDSQDPNAQIRNPLVVNTKGSKKKTAKKDATSVEKSKTKVRKVTCSACGQEGHTSRSKCCPGRRVSDSEETVDGDQSSLSDVADLQGNIDECY
jgi:hypothetical protein